METLTERATGWRSFVDGCQRLACGQRSSFERLVRSVSTLLENSALRTPIEICAARHILASLLARYREVDPETQLKFIKLVIVEDIDTVKLSLARYTPTRITFSARVQRFIDANYLHQCRLDLVAAEFNVSVGTLTSRFKAECGVTIHDYTSLLRARRALELIQTTEIKVAAAANGSGVSVSSFYKTLKAHSGFVRTIGYGSLRGANGKRILDNLDSRLKESRSRAETGILHNASESSVAGSAIRKQRS